MYCYRHLRLCEEGLPLQGAPHQVNAARESKGNDRYQALLSRADEKASSRTMQLLTAGGALPAEGDDSARQNMATESLMSGRM